MGYQLVDCVREQMDRLLNIVLAVSLLVITAPLLLLAMLAIKWESPGPVLHRQASVDRGGRRFELLSFRTIEWDPGRERWGREVTRVGCYLEYTRIAALPQLFNVLRGDMNLVEVGRYSSSSWL